MLTIGPFPYYIKDTHKKAVQQLFKEFFWHFSLRNSILSSPEEAVRKSLWSVFK